MGYLKKSLAKMAGILLIGVPMMTQAADHALLGLVSGPETGPVMDRLAGALGAAGCNISRAGRIMDEAGDIDIDRPDRFFWLSCDRAPDLENADFDNLRDLAEAERLVLLSGPAKLFPEDDSGSAVPGRAYILKLSHFNNRSPYARSQDLADIRNATIHRPGRYRREGFIRVASAMGMETPDEALLLYYDSPAQGEEFRGNNPDILEMIEDFNKTHLNDHIYYFGAAVR